MNLMEYKLDLIAEAVGAYRIEDVAAVVRRQHTNPDDGRITDVVDFYPPWNQWGTYGKMKLAHEYLDEAWQRERFEKHAGVAVADLPLYEGQQAMQRRFGVVHKCEVEIRPFRLMVKPRQGEDGKFEKTLILRYLPAPRPRQVVPATNGNGRSSEPAPVPEPSRAGGAEVDKDWAADAASSQDALFFDTAMVKVEPWFKDADAVRSFREVIWPDGYMPEHGRGYVAGLVAYAQQRQKANGSKEAHLQAKARALAAFRQVLEID